ncbi:MAG: IS1634 family transposase [Cyanobacteriota bacterium]
MRKSDPYFFTPKVIGQIPYLYVQRYIYPNNKRKTESFSLGPIRDIEKIFTTLMSTARTLFFGEALLYFFSQEIGLQEKITKDFLIDKMNEKEIIHFHWLTVLRSIRPFSKYRLFRYIPQSYMSLETQVPHYTSIYYTMDDIKDLPNYFTHLSNFLAQSLHYTPKETHFDTTTIYFFSDYDFFRRKGFGKDGKRGSPLIKLSMACSEDYFPLEYKIYPGNVSDITTFKEYLQKMYKDPFFKEKTVVFDAGCYAFDIIQELEENKVYYVCSADITKYYLFSEPKESIKPKKRKKRSQIIPLPLECPEEPVQKIILNEQEWTIKPGIYQGKRVIIAFNEDHHREASAKLDQKIDLVIKFAKEVKGRTLESKKGKIQSLINGLGLKALLEIIEEQSDLHIVKKNEKIDKRRKSLRKIVLITNYDYSISSIKILEQYLRRTTIERVFRYLKSPIDLRPVYHWKERRIRAHCFIVALGFLILAGFRLYLLYQHQVSVTFEQLIEILQISSIIVLEPKRGFYMPYLSNQKKWINELVTSWKIPIKYTENPLLSFK